MIREYTGRNCSICFEDDEVEMMVETAVEVCRLRSRFHRPFAAVYPHIGSPFPPASRKE